MRDITLATIHEGLDQLENPVVMLNQYLRDMEQEIKKAEKSLTKQMLLLESFKREEQLAKEMVTKRMEQAEFALKAGEEDLARKALISKAEFEEKQQYYHDLVVQNEQSVAELKLQLNEMVEKYKQMKDKKYALIARANSAKAKADMQKTLSEFNHEKAQAGFRRMEERIYELETEASLSKETIYSYHGMSFGKNQAAIEEELKAMKERLQQ